MTAKIIADLHSEVDALRSEVRPGDTLLLLGDLVNIIDYALLDGILVEIYGAEAVRKVIDLRAEQRFDEAREVMASRRRGRETEFVLEFESLLRAAYLEVGQALHSPTFLIPGNIDSPLMIEELIRPGVELVDGKVVEVEGLRVGFVGGGLPTPLRVAGEVAEEEFNAKLEGLGDVDVLCSHMPPDLPDLTYDTVAARHERGSPKLLEYVQEVQPSKVFFGHIHQPLVSSMHVGNTHLVNVGYFRRTKRAFPMTF